MKKYDVLSIGSLYLDVYCLNFPITDGFKIETQTVGKDYTTSPGGSAVIFSSVAALLGLKPVLIGKIGSDAIGDIVEKKLEETQIKTELIKSTKHSTNMSVNYINPEGKNLLTTVGSANQSLSADEILTKVYSYLDSVTYLYLGSFYKLKQLHDHYPQLISAAKAKNVKIVLDHGRVTNVVTRDQINQVKDLLSEIDIYIPSKDEFLHTFSVDSIEAGFQKIKELSSNTTVVVTDAENPAVGMDRDHQVFTADSVAVTPVNTVGAGDTFNAGFITAQIQGKNLADSMQFAHKVAAYKISKNKYPHLTDIK